MHFGFNWGDSDNNISKDIKLFFESGVDDVTEFLGGFGDDSLEESEEVTGFVKFCRAEGSFGRFFIGDCKDGHYGLGFELLVVVFLADVVIKI